MAGRSGVWKGTGRVGVQRVVPQCFLRTPCVYLSSLWTSGLENFAKSPKFLSLIWNSSSLPGGGEGEMGYGGAGGTLAQEWGFSWCSLG